LIEEKKFKGRINIPNFWIRRILRIWPLYFACIFVGFIVFPYLKSMMGGVPNETANPLYYLTFISNFDYINNSYLYPETQGMPDAPILGVLWSVAIEEQFYLVWPILLGFIPLRWYWVPFCTVILGSLIFRATHDVPKLHEMHTLSCIGDMAIGAFGAWLIQQREKFKQFFEELPRALIILLYVLLIGIFLFRDEVLLQSFYTRIFERAFIAVIMLSIILEQCYSKNSFYKLSSFPKITKLGVYTYGLYCIHFLVISITMGITKKLGLNTQLWQVLLLEPIIALAITIVIAKLSYRFFESPFLKLKDRFGYITKH
jgi:peptidoglycan/LPS O-acetylase OafA/YrhL